jgi:Family of unknown function (DUF6082)
MAVHGVQKAAAQLGSSPQIGLCPRTGSRGIYLCTTCPCSHSPRLVSALIIRISGGVITLAIAIISLIISCVALGGVAAGLMLQARQVRVSQIQTVRSAQLELIKLALEYPIMASAAAGVSDPDLFSQASYLNWQMKYFEMGYETGYFSDSAVRRIAVILFEVEIPRNWWAGGREMWASQCPTKRARQFFALVDAEFQRYNSPDSSSAALDNREGNQPA